MNLLNPFSWGKRDNKATAGRNLTARESEALGPYTSTFRDFRFRETNPHLLEAIREAMGPIDGAINKLVMLDGIVRPEAESDALQRELDDWFEGVKVNDVEQGFQAFYRSQGNEMYEQGFTVGDFELSGTGNDVERLRVADSKGVMFRRNGKELECWYLPPGQKRGRQDGTDNLERVLRNTYQSHNMLPLLEQNHYRMLDWQTLVYAGLNNEADNPYGVSIIRSTEFDCRVLLVMKNALNRTWERFGDPIFEVSLKKKSKRNITQKEMDDQRDALAKSLSDAMSIKRQGNSADVVNVIGADDELSIKVLGADGQVLELEMPARHLLENIVAKTGLPSWMLGFHWSTAERLAQRQGEIALQESHTRFELRRPQLKKTCNAALRARGISFKPGDYDLIQDLPNLQDLEAQARANLMDAQAEALRNGGDINPGQQGDREEDDDPKKQLTVYRIANSDDDARLLEAGHRLIHGKGHNHKAETYVEDEAALMRLERRAERGLKNGWDSLYEATLDVLGIDKPKAYKAPEPVFVFDAALMLQDLIDAQDQFVASVSGEDSETAQAMYDSWLRGTLNASNEDLLQGLDKVTQETRNQVAQQIQARSLELVTDATVRAYRDDIVAALQQGAYDGANPRDVARELKKRFAAHDYDWQRLARSEIADAQVAGKEAQYQAHEIARYDIINAGGACPICTGLAANGPYQVGAGPLPMRDTHPLCRCTIEARVE